MTKEKFVLSTQVYRNILSASKLRRMTEEEYAKLNIPKEISGDERVRALFDKHGGLFSFDGTFGHTIVMEHEIKLKPGARPVK